MDTGFTRKIEGELDEIEEARKEWVEVVQDFYGPFAKDLATAESRMTHARAESDPSPYKCPKCQAAMVYKLNRRGKRFLSCTRYPECDGAQNIDREGKPAVLDVTEYMCPTCGKPMIRRQGRFGTFFGCSGYPECKVIQNADRKTGLPLPPKPPPVDTGLLCPKCGKKNIVVREGKRGPFMSCSGFPRCRTTLPAERLEEFKKSLAETGKWPEDIVAKFGATKVAAGAAAPAAEEKPKKKAAAKKKASGKAKTKKAESPAE
jgi:DNA topoisomerase-1